MLIRLESKIPVPPYEQIRAQVSLSIAAGSLRPGSRLPTIRRLARQLDLAPGTVARAYRELEADGVVEGRGRSGTFVVDEPPIRFEVVERQERLEEAAGRYASEVRHLAAEPAAAIEAVAIALAELAEVADPAAD